MEFKKGDRVFFKEKYLNIKKGTTGIVLSSTLFEHELLIKVNLDSGGYTEAFSRRLDKVQNKIGHQLTKIFQ